MFGWLFGRRECEPAAGATVIDRRRPRPDCCRPLGIDRARSANEWVRWLYERWTEAREQIDRLWASYAQTCDLCDRLLRRNLELRTQLARARAELEQYRRGLHPPHPPQGPHFGGCGGDDGRAA